MANPLETITKPIAFGARQAINITQQVFRGAASLVGAVRGGDGGSADAEAQQQSQPPRQTRRSSSQPKSLDDVSITRKVESEIFRGTAVAKGKISVNTAEGVVWLRGEAKTPAMIKELERKARAVPEVRQVENLLHLPKTPAPSRTDTPPTQRKTRRSKPGPAGRRVTPRRVTEEKREPSVAEPAPTELAAERRGRPPAPLGGDAPSQRPNGSGAPAPGGATGPDDPASS